MSDMGNNIRLGIYVLLVAIAMYFTRPPSGPSPSIVAGAPEGWAVYGEAPHEYYLRDTGQLELDLPLPPMPPLGETIHAPQGHKCNKCHRPTSYSEWARNWTWCTPCRAVEHQEVGE